MTLVIAKKFNDEVYIISDSAIIDPLKIRIDPADNTPKILNLKRFVVAFAGQINVFWKYQQQYNDCLTAQQLVGVCREIRRENKGLVDYLVLDLATKKMFQMKNQTSECNQVAWLGDQEAYGKFQSIRLDGALSPLNPILKFVGQEGSTQDYQENYCSDLLSFQELIRHPNLNVGGYAVPYVSTFSRSSFGNYRFVDAGNAPQQYSPEWQPINWAIGQPQDGAYDVMFSGSPSGYSIRLSQLGKEFLWHSPFVEELQPEPCVDFG